MSEEKGLVLRPSYWASVSGGKDSLYMLKLILDNPDRYPLDGVVHYELQIDYPFIKDVIDYMESQCKKHGIRFVRVKPRYTWMSQYEKYGFPTRFRRWCNRYKLDAEKQLKEFLKQQGCYLVNYIGYCADEQIRAQRNIKKKKSVYPLIEFGIEQDYILEWAKTVPVFNDYYKYNRRCGCMLCPMASMSNMAYLLKYYPNEYKKLMALAKAHEDYVLSEYGKPFSVFSGNPKYNTEYRDRVIREKYLPKLEEEIKKYADPL